MSASQPGQLESLVRERILRPLAALRMTCRLYMALDGVMQLVLLLMATSVVQLLLDRSLRLTLDQRAAFNLLITCVWLWGAYRYILLPLITPLEDDHLARLIDRANSKLSDRITTAVQFGRGSVGPAETNSPALVAAVVREACEAARHIPFLAIVNHRRAGLHAALLTGLLASIAGTWLLLPDPMNTWLRRNWLMQDIPWPQSTYITPEGFDAAGRRRAPRGDELMIVAGITGKVPDSATLIWSDAAGRSGRQKMVLVGRKRFEASLGTLTGNVRFRITGGDEHTREFVVEAVERPTVIRTVARITPPEYTELPAVELESQNVLEMLARSRLEIEAWLNKPVASLSLDGGERDLPQWQRIASDRFLLRWDDPQAGSFDLLPVDFDGWGDRSPVRLTIRINPDDTPAVRMTLGGAGDMITPEAEIPIELQYEDSFGLSRVSLFVRRGQDPQSEIALAGFVPGSRNHQASPLFAVAELNVRPGDRLEIWAEAADNDPAGPNVGRCESVVLTVVSAEDLLAMLLRREYELRREFEQLLSAQRGLRDALDRLLPALAPDSLSTAQIQQLVAQSRRQESHAARVRVIHDRYRQILMELRTNKLARARDESRIGDRIMAPLGHLADNEMARAAEAVVRLRERLDEAALEEVDASQRRVVQLMQQILSQMLQWEGYQEAVTLLSEIIEAQHGVRETTLEAIERQLADILGLEEPPEPPGPPREP